MVQATMSLEGIEQVVEQIAGLEARLADPVPALEVTADLLELHVAANFETQGARVGQPWAPLRPSTVKARTRRWGYYRRARAGGVGPIGPILTWTGRGRRSLRKGGADHVRQVSASGLVWGSSYRSLAYHQSTGPRRVLPRRPPLAFRDEFQLREIGFQPLRLWLQGIPLGAIRTTMRARLRL